MTIMEQIKAARYVSTPLIAVATPDPAETMRNIREAFENGAKTPIPMFRWDALNGLTAANTVAISALKKLLGEDLSQWPALTANPGAALDYFAQLPGEIREGGDSGPIVQRGSVIFMLNAQRCFEDRPGSNNGQVIQGIWNLRDLYKETRRTLVILGPGFKLPPEIAQDVIVFDEPYPGEDQLRAIVIQQAADAVPPIALDDATVAQAVDALRSLPAFTAEQVAAMSLVKDGLDVDALWQRKISVIEQTDGLSVDRGAESFDDVGGLDQFKKFSLRLVRSKTRAPMLFVRIDEIEKMLGGIGTNNSGDNTGVSQDALGVILKNMEDNKWTGLIAIGHAGTGKSLVTKALANTATKESGRKVLSIAMDLGAARGGIVGESERKIRTLMKTIKSLAGDKPGRVCFVGTCNDLEIMPPALRRRFTRGIWFFDLPSKEEREGIWAINKRQFGIEEDGHPEDTDWTGADIRNVCEIASALECPLAEATQYVVFVAKTDPESIDRLRKRADGKWLSANKPGMYKASFLTTAFGQPSGGKRARREEE